MEKIGNSALKEHPSVASRSIRFINGIKTGDFSAAFGTGGKKGYWISWSRNGKTVYTEYSNESAMIQAWVKLNESKLTSSLENLVYAGIVTEPNSHKIGLSPKYISGGNYATKEMLAAKYSLNKHKMLKELHLNPLLSKKLNDEAYPHNDQDILTAGIINQLQKELGINSVTRNSFETIARLDFGFSRTQLADSMKSLLHTGIITQLNNEIALSPKYISGGNYSSKEMLEAKYSLNKHRMQKELHLNPSLSKKLNNETHPHNNEEVLVAGIINQVQKELGIDSIDESSLKLIAQADFGIT